MAMVGSLFNSRKLRIEKSTQNLARKSTKRDAKGNRNRAQSGARATKIRHNLVHKRNEIWAQFCGQSMKTWAQIPQAFYSSSAVCLKTQKQRLYYTNFNFVTNLMSIRAGRYVNRAGGKGVMAGHKGVRAERSTLRNMTDDCRLLRGQRRRDSGQNSCRSRRRCVVSTATRRRRRRRRRWRRRRRRRPRRRRSMSTGRTGGGGRWDGRRRRPRWQRGGRGAGRAWGWNWRNWKDRKRGRRSRRVDEGGRGREAPLEGRGAGLPGGVGSYRGVGLPGGWESGAARGSPGGHPGVGSIRVSAARCLRGLVPPGWRVDKLP